MWTRWLALAVLGCRPEGDDSAPALHAPAEPVPDRPDTGVGTGGTGGTDGPAPSGMYPEAPYDCAQGVPQGEPAVRELDGIRTTEGLAFTVSGALVAEQSTGTGALIAWTRDGAASMYSLGVGSARGLGMAGNGDVLVADGLFPSVWGVMPQGQTRLAATLPDVWASPGLRAAAEVDGASDGTLAVGTLYGGAFVVRPDGEVLTLGRVGEIGMGAAFSVDESRVWFSRWNDTGSGQIFVSDRDAAGGWSAIRPWASLPSARTLSGLTVDACDNVYAIDEGCQIFRIGPEGVVDRLVDLDDHLQIQPMACRTLAFGRGLGGWDAYRLYATTYGELAEIDVGVPGRPR